MMFPYPQPCMPTSFPPPVNPLLQFLPVSAQQQFAALQGKTQYRYHTSDGGVPMDGSVPTGSAFDPPKPQQPLFPLMQGMNCVPGAVHPSFPNGSSGPINFCGPPSPYQCGPPPAVYHCVPAGPAVQPPAYHCTPVGPAAPQVFGGPQQPPPPPPPPGHEFHSTKEREAPVRGNRVKGQLAKFDNGMGYIFPEKNACLHILKYNPLAKPYEIQPIPGSDAAQGQGQYRINIAQFGFTAQTVPCSMTFEELIRQIGCQDRANQGDYSRPGNPYPMHAVGVQELLPVGDGTYVLGVRITLTSYQAKAQIGEIWPDTVGTAGEEKPRIIYRLPV